MDLSTGFKAPIQSGFENARATPLQRASQKLSQDELIFSTSSKLMHTLTKLQAIVRGRRFRKNNSTVQEHLATKAKREFDHTNHFEAFDRNSWRDFYKSDPNTPIDESRLKFKEILEGDSFYAGKVNVRGKPHGFGVLKYKNGIKKEGLWLNGELTGWGRVSSGTGECFEGLFKNGVLHGKGRKINSEGDYYEGDFEGGNKEGRGLEETETQKYEGEFKNNVKHGKGSVFFKEKKDFFEGEFRNNVISGFGKLAFSQGDCYEGQFENGLMHGKGKYIWSDRTCYEGDYYYGEKTGVGVFEWPDGRVFKGPFTKGVPNGRGELKGRDKRKYNVLFEFGKIKEKELI